MSYQFEKLRLCLSPIPNKIKIKILEDFQEKENLIQELSPQAWQENYGIMQAPNYGQDRDQNLDYVKKEMEEIQKRGIELLFFSDDDYPSQLKEIPSPPAIIYKKGDCALDNPRSLALVGTRRASQYGINQCKSLVKELAFDKITSISGLAYGIDTQCHQSSIEYGIPTIAVLGNGLDLNYPRQNEKLAQEIIEKGGCLLSEYPLGYPSLAQNFPQRNRIIAGLCQALIIIEASIKGGALISANMAFDYNRMVYAIPGRNGDYYSEGCNLLIMNTKAKLIRNVNDIRNDLKWELPYQNINGGKLALRQQSLFNRRDKEEIEQIEKLYALIKKQNPSSIDFLVGASKMELSQVLNLLSSMEIIGIIKTKAGRIYSSPE